MTTHAAAPSQGEPSRLTLWTIFLLSNACIAATVVLCYLTARFIGLPPAKVFATTGKLVAAHIFGGRFVNAGVGVLAQGGRLPDWFIVYQCWVYDFVLMCYGYLGFALGFHRFAHWPIVGPYLDSAHKTALSHSDAVRPYGITGLMAFIVIPMGGIGPMVGTILGYILGLSATSIFLWLGVADLVWTIAFVYLYSMLAHYSQPLALAVLGLLIAGIVGGIGLRIWRGLRKTEAVAPPVA